MYIARIRVENVRGFYDERAVDLDLKRPDGTYAGWTVIAGRNGSGKSSLLRAIVCAVSDPYLIRNLMPDFANWVTSGRRRGSVLVDLVDLVADGRVDVPVDGEVLGALTSNEVAWTFPSNRDERTPQQPRVSSGRSTPGPWQENAAGWFCAAYGPFRRLAGGAGDAQRLMQAPGQLGRFASLS